MQLRPPHQLPRALHQAGVAALHRNGQVARTVTTKLRYADFSIRTRSLTLDVAVDDAETIGEVACRLLDRALADRPGALRLVGVGLKGFETHRQLALNQPSDILSLG